MVQAAIDGVYADPFFESYPDQQDAFDRRLRANIQRMLTVYAEDMCKDGHALEIVEDGLKPIQQPTSKYIMRSEYLVLVKKFMVECRGRELLGTFNLVVGDLFSRQCKPWEKITASLAEQVHNAAMKIFNKIITQICDNNTRNRLMKGLIQPSLHNLREELKDKLDELLAPHLSIHPITYHDYLTETVQRVQGVRHDRAFNIVSKTSCAYTADSVPLAVNIPLSTLLTALKALRLSTGPNVKEYSTSLAADVALKKFIDDVSINAVEACLIQRLPEVFSPDVAWDLTPEQVDKLGSEDDGTVTERASLQKKLSILDQGLTDLDAFTAAK